MKDDKNTIDRRAAFIGALLHKPQAWQGDAALIDWAIEAGLGGMVYYRFLDRLTGESRQKCQQQYRYGAVQDLKYAAAYQEIKTVFEAASIDFVPLKGMALIRQKVYDNGALRLHCDFDVLLRGESVCRQAFDLLSAAGWKYTGQPDYYHHIPGLHKNGVAVELHHHVPGIDDENKIGKLWQEAAFFIDKNEYHFPLELHFALAFAHCGNHHDWESGGKFLLDAGLLAVQKGFDWQKCFAYCHEFGIGKPEVLVSSFPEIFGGDAVVAPEYQVLRTRVLGDFIPFAALEATAKDRFSWAWWCRHIDGLKLSRLRGRYHAEGAPWYKMLLIMWKCLWHKFQTLCRYFFASDQTSERKKTSDACGHILDFTVNPNEL